MYCCRALAFEEPYALSCSLIERSTLIATGYIEQFVEGSLRANANDLYKANECPAKLQNMADDGTVVTLYDD